MVFRLCLLVRGHVCMCSFITGLQRNPSRALYDIMIYTKGSPTSIFKLTCQNWTYIIIYPNALINIITIPPDAQNRHLCGILVHTSIFISSYTIFTLKYVSICISSLYFCYRFLLLVYMFSHVDNLKDYDAFLFSILPQFQLIA